MIFVALGKQLRIDLSHNLIQFLFHHHPITMQYLLIASLLATVGATNMMAREVL